MSIMPQAIGTFSSETSTGFHGGTLGPPIIMSASEGDGRKDRVHKSHLSGIFAHSPRGTALYPEAKRRSSRNESREIKKKSLAAQAGETA